MFSKFEKMLKNFFMWRSSVCHKSDYKVSFITKIKAVLKGFSVNEYVWYNLKENNADEYISEFERVKARDINGEYKIILDDKILFEEVFKKHVKVPTNYAWIKDGIIYNLNDFNIDNNNILEFIEKQKNVILKLERGYEGKGVFLISFSENKFYLNGEEVPMQKIEELLFMQGGSILCEYICQSEFENYLYPHSNNTLRIVCAKKKGEKEAKIIKAFQRIGNDYCKLIDNISAGGFASEIDIDTGRLGHIIAKYGPMERRMKPLKNHPDTGNLIEGQIIPNWQNIKKEIIDLTNKFPYLNFVAWDVSLTENGVCIIEGNASSGCGLFQLEHGIKKEEYGEILKSYGFCK